MKMILRAVIAVLLLLGLAACTSGNPSATTSTPPAASVEGASSDYPAPVQQLAPSDYPAPAPQVTPSGYPAPSASQ